MTKYIRCDICGKKTTNLYNGYYVGGFCIPVKYCDNCKKNINIMKQEKFFFFKSSAQKFADKLHSDGYTYDLYPAHYFGPRDCFFWGWKVTWE